MNKILQFMGLRSRCCGAAIIDWHFDRQYCADCEHQIHARLKFRPLQ